MYGQTAWAVLATLLAITFTQVGSLSLVARSSSHGRTKVGGSDFLHAAHRQATVNASKWRHDDYHGLSEESGPFEAAVDGVHHWLSKESGAFAAAVDGLIGSEPELPAKRRALYFRPVSVTLWCVMILCVQSILIYTALALARNHDELSGKLRPSVLTETLSVASRAANFSSMLAMLFTGCRMYVLATSEGLGEPPLWVKAGMVAATVGTTLQLLTVFMLPHSTVHSHEEGKTFSEVSGTQADVFPALDNHEFTNSDERETFWGQQSVSIVLIYGGTIVVIVGIFTYPVRTTRISAAVVTTCILSAVYFSVFFVLWLARQRSDADKVSDKDAERYYRTIKVLEKKTPAAALPEKALPTENNPSEAAGAENKPSVGQSVSGTAAADGQETADAGAQGSLLGAALAMSAAVRKAPMLAVLFLAVRMRALQLDPPHGMPPPHVQICFYTVAGAMCLEVLIAAYIGFTSADNVFYYGAHVFSATKAERTLQNICSGVIYCCLCPVVASIFEGRAVDGSVAPLSPTMWAVLQLAGLFLLIEFGQWFTITFMETGNTTLRDTFLAAGVSITFAPLICVLFVACRMRALQITQQQGSPQSWAQDCMYLCVLATCIQVLCCLLMPIFTNAATVVDEHGHPDYDFRPLFGAYVVSVIKYIALMCLHGGVIGVSIAVFTMTPETARSDQTSGFSNLRDLYRIVGVLLVVVLFAMFISSAKVVGLVIKWGIESVDTVLLGTEIEVAVAKLNICEGYVNVGGLKVYNPSPPSDLEKGAAHKWSSDYLMKVDKLLVKVNMWKLFTSLGKSFELQAIMLQGLDVNAEKPSFKGMTNLGLIVEHVEKQAQAVTGVQDKGKKALPAPELKAKAMVEDKKLDKGEEKHADDQSLELIVQKVCIESIGGSVISPVGTLSLKAPDIVFDNFQEKMSSNHGKPEELVVAIIKVILEAVLENTATSFLAMFPGKEMANNALGKLGRTAAHCCHPSPSAPAKSPGGAIKDI